MSKRNKLIAKFLDSPTDFHFSELVRLLGYFGYKEQKMGKTSGSRVKFVNEKGEQILLHRPHPSGLMKKYQLKQIKEMLGL